MKARTMANRRENGSHSSQRPLFLSIGLFCIIILATIPFSRGDVLQDQSKAPAMNVQSSKAQQVMLQNNHGSDQHKPQKIAIIGGGISGLSLAHFLRRENPLAEDALQITILEKEPQVGGRVRMARSYGDNTGVDTGGHTFDSDDELMAELLRTTDGNSYSAEILYEYSEDGWRFENSLGSEDRATLWDGETLVTNVAEEPPLTWTSLMDILRQHGLKPRFWSKFYQNLQRARSDESLQGLFEWDFDSPFDARDYKVMLIWAAAWARPGPDTQTLRSFAHANSVNLKAQNYTTTVSEMLSQLLYHLSKDDKGLSLKLNSTVSRITRRPLGRGFLVQGRPNAKTFSYDFDHVVIAAPSSQAQITISPPVASPPKFVAYTPLHVTHFISRRPMDPRAFNLPPDTSVPMVIWNVGNTTSSFLSISQEAHPVLEGCIAFDEPIYRVISKEPFSDRDIASLFNKFGEARKDVTFPEQFCGALTDTERWGMLDWREALQVNPLDGEVERKPDCVNDPTIRWVHRDYWPNGMPVVETSSSGKEEPMELAPRLFYVSGFETHEGSSISKSLRSASRVKDMLLAGIVEGYEAV